MSQILPFQQTIALAPDGWAVEIFDQTLLPHKMHVRRLETVEDAAEAIVNMRVRGSNLIGVTSAHGMALAMRADASDDNLCAAYSLLIKTRPTAVNLRCALDEFSALLRPLAPAERAAAAYKRAAELILEDIAATRAIGEHGFKLLQELASKKKNGEPLQILTHCNAGRLATIGPGTATAPIYHAHAAGLPVHVWVSETRPRIQGALTAWELAEQGVPCTVVADNSAGHLMQRGLIDVFIVGADRVTARGDVANKIGTYLKSLAAREHGIPFFVAFVGNSIDWTIEDGVKDIPIEQRSAREVTHVTGVADSGELMEVRALSAGTAARNDAFDVTPAELVTAVITERGACKPTLESMKALFPEKQQA